MDGKNFDRERRGGKGAFNGQSDTYSRCLVPGRGEPAQFLKAGDVIVTQDGVKYWHGAAKDSWFEHIAITAGTPVWLEPVTEEHYNHL